VGVSVGLDSGLPFRVSVRASTSVRGVQSGVCPGVRDGFPPVPGSPVQPAKPTAASVVSTSRLEGIPAVPGVSGISPVEGQAGL